MTSQHEFLRHAAILQSQQEPDPILDIQVEALLFPYVEPMHPCPWTSTPGWRMKGVLALRHHAMRQGEVEILLNRAFGRGLLYATVGYVVIIAAVIALMVSR